MSEHTESSTPDDLAEVRWASRVNPTLIRRLYEADARGLLDDDLLDQTGFALYARCRSILRATAAGHGRVACPRCERTVLRAASGPWAGRDELLRCACGWTVRWGDYFETYQGKHLVGGGALPFHERFVVEWERAGTPQRKMLAIDGLIHAFHWELVTNPGRPAARELIYARNTTELLTFLDRLTYGERSTPGLGDARAAWQAKLGASEWHRMTGFRPRPASGRDEEAGAG
jgi:hypothetical protein